MTSSRQRRAPLAAEIPPAGASFAERFPPTGGLRAARRFLMVLLWTLACAAVQAVLLVLPGRSKARLPRLYWRQVCRLLGMEMRIVGDPARPEPGRPVVYAANHSSWLDIPVLGGTLEACFIAKGEIERWPVINVIALLGRTVFVTRGRDTLAAEREAMAARLAAGDSLILFPEGTSSDGTRVLPFRSTFFSLAEGAAPPLVQPVSVVYDRLAWLPAGRVNRSLFAWYGDMDLASHSWRLAKCSGLRATVVLHQPIDPAAADLNRKQISALAWASIANGAATLRQNRAPVPLPSSPRA